MWRATLLPEPERPLTTTRRMMGNSWSVKKWQCYTERKWLVKLSVTSHFRSSNQPFPSGELHSLSFQRVMVVQFLFVLFNATIEFVRECVDGGIHVLVNGIGVNP